jgi:hypothetical protein
MHSCCGAECEVCANFILCIFCFLRQSLLLVLVRVCAVMSYSCNKQPGDRRPIKQASTPRCHTTVLVGTAYTGL